LIAALVLQTCNLERTPAIAVSNCSFEHVLQHVELAGLLSTSSKGMSATTATRSGFVFITVQGLLRITNRAGKLFFTKSALTSEPFIGSRMKLLKNFFWKNIAAGG